MSDVEVREEFFGRPWVGVLGVASDDGRPPLTVPVFYAYVDGLVTFYTGTQARKTRKTRLIARAKQVSLCVQQTDGGFKTVTAECAVVGTDRAPSVDQVVAIAGRYMPEEDARAFAAAELDAPTGTFVLFTARPERWLEMGL